MHTCRAYCVAEDSDIKRSPTVQSMAGVYGSPCIMGHSRMSFLSARDAMEI